jgi:hypothetical protein
MRRLRAAWPLVVAVLGAVAVGGSGRAAPPQLAKIRDGFAPLFVESVVATSTFVDKHDGYAAWRTLLPTVQPTGENGDEVQYLTAWCEGKPDEGVGEGITITFAAPTKLESVTVGAGVWKTEKLFAANNRILSLVLATSDGRKLTATPPDRREPVGFELGGQAVTWIKLTIGAVTRGRMNDSCLSFISLIPPANAPGDVLVAVPRAALDALPAALQAIDDALDRCAAAELSRWIDFPLAVRSNRWFFEGGSEPKQPTRYQDAAALARAKCPVPSFMLDDIALAGAGPGTILVWLQHNELPERWQLTWRGGQWRLGAADYQ